MDDGNTLSAFSESLNEIISMAQILVQDCQDQYEAIRVNDSQTNRRAYVRSVFAFIEGVVYRIQVAVQHLGILLGNISLYELVVLDGVQLDISEKGEVTTRPFYPALLHNIKFTFKIFSKSFGSSFKLNVSGAGWNHLVHSSKVRNRLMHPKEVADLQISDKELQSARLAFEWFFINYTLSGQYALREFHTATPPSAEEIAVLDKRIQHLENELAARGN